MNLRVSSGCKARSSIFKSFLPHLSPQFFLLPGFYVVCYLGLLWSLLHCFSYKLGSMLNVWYKMSLSQTDKFLFFQHEISGGLLSSCPYLSQIRSCYSAYTRWINSFHKLWQQRHGKYLLKCIHEKTCLSVAFQSVKMREINMFLLKLKITGFTQPWNLCF